jgi:hypothetical protein
MQFLLFGSLQHGSTLHEFSNLLTRRAAIILDDSPDAWGDHECALLVYVNRAKTLSSWASTPWENTVNFHMYMHALAACGAEVLEEPQRVAGSKARYRLVPTEQSELATVSARLTSLHDHATMQNVLTSVSAAARYEQWVRAPVLLDALLPVTGIIIDSHFVALEREKQKLVLANAEIEKLQKRVRMLQNNSTT